MSQYALTVNENYLSSLNATATEIYAKYLGSVAEFVEQAETSLPISNVEYFRYVVLKGIETLTHVFRMLILYTRNVDLTFFNSKKALYYFIEFIGQIGEDHHDFLSLTSTDATMFVYKKTVFSLETSMRKEFKEKDEEKIIIDNVFLLTELTLKALTQLLNSEEVTKNDDLGKAFDKLRSYGLCLANLSIDRTPELFNEKLSLMQDFVDQMASAPFKDMAVYEAMSKKLDKNDMNSQELKASVDSSIEKIDELTTRRFVNAVTSAATSN